MLLDGRHWNNDNGIGLYGRLEFGSYQFLPQYFFHFFLSISLLLDGTAHRPRYEILLEEEHQHCEIRFLSAGFSYLKIGRSYTYITPGDLARKKEPM